MPFFSESPARDVPSLWLSSTRLVDLNDPKLRILAMSLTQLADTDTQKVVAIHGFIKTMPFGCAASFEHMAAGDVLRSGQGDCHTKGTLFVALMRCAGLPARLRFVTMPSGFLRGIISLPKVNVVHAIGEVYLGERWVRTDTYVADEVLEAEAARLLVKEGKRMGYGIHLNGARQWDAFHDAFGQSAVSDPASLPLQDWGVAHDPEQFYAAATDPSLKMGWMTRVKWMLAAGLVNRRTQWVRLQTTDGLQK
jgi:hypothetical protein